MTCFCFVLDDVVHRVNGACDVRDADMLQEDANVEMIFNILVEEALMIEDDVET